MDHIKIKLKDREIGIELYDNPLAKELYSSLPQIISMDRWGGEYYGGIDFIFSHGDLKKRETFLEGEVALWPAGNAFCIFFGPTPASLDERPRMISPGVPLGIIQEDLTFLETLDSSIIIELTK